jgi:hypothetical protein
MDLSAALKEHEEHYPEAPEVLTPGPVLSLEAVRPQFSEYLIRVAGMKRDAEAITVENDETLKYAVALGGEAKKIVKALDAKRKDVTAEAADFVKSVNGFIKMFTDKLDDIEKALKKKIGDYQYRVELERRKQEETAKKAAAELQAKIDAEAKQAGVEAPVVVAPVIPKTRPIVRTETGTSSYQANRWICTVIDPAAVPREYCEPSKKLLDDAVKMGIREIAGCKIEEVSENRFRT